MPKETIKAFGKQKVEVKWGKGHFDAIQLGVDLGSRFKFNGGDETFTGLWFTFENEDELDRLIWILKRAKKQSFN